MSIFVGCATKSAFIYDRPEMKGGVASGRVLVCGETVDNRAEHDLDKVYEGDTLEQVRMSIEQEMMSTGLFEKVVWAKTSRESEESPKTSGRQFFLNTSLNELKWEVPGYQALQTKAFVAGFATGLVGGLIYGATSTDVNGASRLTVQFSDRTSGKLLIDKEYTGSYKTTKAKLKCDSNDTKAEVAGKALKDAMEQFKADILKTLANAGTATEAASAAP
jgi:hypothetical protein